MTRLLGNLLGRLFPALRQSRDASRPGDPQFSDEDTRRRYADVRRQATDAVLRRIAESPWGDTLILRGSRMLRAWLGDAAREPGDLDWVADSRSPLAAARRAERSLQELIAAVVESPGPVGIQFLANEVTTEDIWAYDRAPGARVMFPWRADGLPRGAVQVDIVLGEVLAEPARRVAIRAADGGCVSVLAASPAQSLAWKLLWLETGMDWEGKDLYDAVLLAERFSLPPAILDQTFADGREDPPTGPAFVSEQWSVGWDRFQAQHPHVVGNVNEWLDRLRSALVPTFAARDGADLPSRPAAEPDPPWRTPTVVAVAEGIHSSGAFSRLPVLADALEDAGCTDADLQTHCRANGPHSRGCQVVDLLLKK